jgi:hypothetical protein
MADQILCIVKPTHMELCNHNFLGDINLHTLALKALNQMIEVLPLVE